MHAFEPGKPANGEPDDSLNRITESLNSVEIVIDVPGNTTIRPRSSGVPRFWPVDLPLLDPTPPPTKPDELNKS
jgi:hypothetical protein